MPPTQTVGCSTIVFRDRPLDEAVRLIAAAGFARADIGIVPGFCPHIDLDRCGVASIARIAGLLDSAGLTAASLNVHPGQLNTAGWRPVADRVRRAIDLAAGLCCPTVTLPAGLPEDDRLWEDAVQALVDRLSGLVDEARARGVSLSVEAPHAGTLLATPDQVHRFFAHAAPATLGCTFDTSHVARAYDGALPVAIERIGLSRINHVHLRDRVGANGMVTPGRGEIDFAAFFDALRAGGADPSVTLELEFRSASIARRNEELRFAIAHLTHAMTGSRPSLARVVGGARLPRLLRRLVVNPVAEIRTQSGSHARRQAPSRRNQLREADGGARRRLATALVSLEPSSHPRAPAWRRRPRAGAVARASRMRRRVRQCRPPPCLRIPPAARRAACRGERPRWRQGGVGRARHGLPGLRLDESRCSRSSARNLVAVCTPEWTHYEIVRRGLLAGRDVFCEKILATRLVHARELVDLAAGQGRVLALNYNYRFIAGVRALRDLTRAGSLGDVLLAHIKVHAFSYHHALDLVTFLFGPISTVRATYATDDAVRAFGGTDWSLFDEDILYVPSKNAAVIFEMASGAFVTLGSSYLDDPLRFLLAIDVTCDRGAASLTGINLFDFSGRLTTSLPHPGRAAPRPRPLAGGYETSFYASIESFVNAYVSGGAAETPGKTGLFNMELEAAIGRSRRSGGVERLSG